MWGVCDLKKISSNIKNQSVVSFPVELKLYLHTIHLLIFGMGKDYHNIYYLTKNQVRGLCVGGEMAILL